MRDVPNLPEAGQAHLVASSWLGGRFLADLPIAAGSWQVDDEADVTLPGRVSFTVPRTPEWTPTHAGHPLAAFGQRLVVSLDVSGVRVPLGVYRLRPVSTQGALIRVEADGLLVELERNALTTPREWPSGISWVTYLSELTAGILPLSTPWTGSGTIEGRTVERDRLEAFWEAVKAMPARAYVDASGALVVADPWQVDDPTVWDLHDGDGGSLVDLFPNEKRDAFNGFVVSTQPEGSDYPVVESWTVPDGPMRWGGPYGRHAGFYESTTLPADPPYLRFVAQDLTMREVRAASELGFTARLLPLAEVGDVVNLRSARHGMDARARVTALSHTRAGTSGRVSLL